MKTEVLDALKERRSIRQYKSEQITDEELNAVLEAGTYAPTGANTQSPTIVAVQNPDDVKTLNALNAKVLADQGREMPTPYYGAPTIVLVLNSEKAITPVEDASLVAGNIMNAAYSIGLGTCWIHRSKNIFDSPEGKALLKKWGLPEDLTGISSIALGYPDCPLPKPSKRKEDYIKIIK